MKKGPQKLTSRDAVLGIGRKATDNELREYLSRSRKEEFKSIDKIRVEVRARLSNNIE